jgi:hypothetical protein
VTEGLLHSPPRCGEHAGRRLRGQAVLEQALVAGLLLGTEPISGGELVIIEYDGEVHTESLLEESGHHSGAVLARVAVEDSRQAGRPSSVRPMNSWPNKVNMNRDGPWIVGMEAFRIVENVRRRYL